MANNPLDTSLLDKAIIFAVKAHSGTERRGKGFPYIVHPMEAMEIVASMTADQELLAAAALHDTVEDRIADLVAAESDKIMEGVSEEESWRARKQAGIDLLTKAPRDVKIVALGDKLSNMRAIARDHDKIGDKIWDMFHAKDKSDHEWRYRSLLEAFRPLEGTAAFEEFEYLVNKVFGEK